MTYAASQITLLYVLVGAWGGGGGRGQHGGNFLYKA